MERAVPHGALESHDTVCNKSMSSEGRRFESRKRKGSLHWVPLQQVAVFSRTWRAARRAGQYMPHKAGIDVYFISVGERQPAQQVCIAKNSFPVSRASLRTFLRKLI
jgi:hypothetical protein